KEDWKRRREIGRLVPLWPHELRIDSIEAHRNLIVLLEKALAGEKQRGSALHWSYDLPRHAAILNLYRAECVAYTRDLHRFQNDSIAARAAQIASEIADRITAGLSRDGEVVA